MKTRSNSLDGSLVAIISSRRTRNGVLVKLAGKVTPNPVTGQLTTTFENNPQLPFDHFNFHFREGQQAPLITPRHAATTPRRPDSRHGQCPTAVLTDSSSFTITNGSDGGACRSGGVRHSNRRSRRERSTTTRDLSARCTCDLYARPTQNRRSRGSPPNLPEGLTGDLTGIPFCPEADIEAAADKTGAQEEAEPVLSRRERDRAHARRHRRRRCLRLRPREDLPRGPYQRRRRSRSSASPPRWSARSISVRSCCASG